MKRDEKATFEAKSFDGQYFGSEFRCLGSHSNPIFQKTQIRNSVAQTASFGFVYNVYRDTTFYLGPTLQ